MHNHDMRTTIDIPDEEYELIAYYANARGISKGKAAGELARKQLAPETIPAPSARLKRKNGLLILSGDGRRKLTSEMVYKALEEEEY